MNIKEMEQRSGLPRSGIRFYESEGLLSPARSPNGYRDYSEDDLATLLKIKRLRALGLSLAEIREVQSGVLPLADALRALLVRLAAMRGELSGAEAECRSLIDAGAGWADMMDVALPSPAAQEALPGAQGDAPGGRDGPGGDFPLTGREAAARAGQPQQEARRLYLDTGIKYSHRRPSPGWTDGYTEPGPWRRYFARFIDSWLYGTASLAFSTLVLGLNPSHESAGTSFFEWLLGSLLLLTVEPLFLHFFAATPGKWLLGISVRDHDGKCLSFSEAFARTWKVYVMGLGLGIPIAALITHLLAYRRSLKGEDQPWDSEYGRWIPVYRAPRRAGITAALAAGGAAALLMFGVLCIARSQMPPHRGDLSTEEFVENYNELSDYFGIGGTYVKLTPEGLVEDAPDGTYVLHLGNEMLPEFHFTEDGGVLTRVELTVDFAGEDGALGSGYGRYYQLAAMAYIWGRPGVGMFNFDARQEVVDCVYERANEAYAAEWGGVTVINDPRYSGYRDYGGRLFPIEGEVQRQELSFVMECG